MKKWVTTQQNTRDGNTLEIIFPIELDDANFECVLEFGPRKYFSTTHNSRDIEFPEFFISPSLQESIKKCRKMLTNDIKNLEDQRVAPPANHDVYINKCKKALITLRNMYSDIHPEEFV